MALTKKAVIDKMEILEDGEVISQSFHRKVITPLNNISGEDAKVQAIANAHWTQEVKDAYQAKLDEAEERRLSGGA